MDQLAHWLKTLTGMPAVALSPRPGARQAVRPPGHPRGAGRPRRCAAHRAGPVSARSCNPATAALAGYQVVEIAQTDDGRVDIADLAAKLRTGVAAVMVTNPNTCPACSSAT